MMLSPLSTTVASSWLPNSAAAAGIAAIPPAGTTLHLGSRCVLSFSRRTSDITVRYV